MLTTLVDTNVLVYLVDPRDRDKHNKAKQLVFALADRRVGCLAVQVLSEYFWATTRRIDPPLSMDEAASNISDLAQSWPVFALTPSVVMEATRAVRQHQLAYGDAQIWAVAHLHQVPFVLSEDFQHGQVVEGVCFLNPFAEKIDLARLGL
ncbi:MAG: PIN domain-containing protein [Cyanobacteria bacterium REEB65]|nr:PIN domain-containing protein [Cyanobacteria bacterium REEB65]